MARRTRSRPHNAPPARGETTPLRPGRQGLLELTPQDIIETHDEVARLGETWHTGVREQGSLDFLADRLKQMVRDGFPPGEIAASALHFIVSEHPFWDANHRTGFQMALLVLGAFGSTLVAPLEEVERYVRGIDREGFTEAQIAAWIRRRAEPLR